MSEPHDPRPWWASTPGAAGAADDADPLTRHRQARAGGPDEESASQDAGAVPTWWGPAAEAVARLSEDLASTATANADAARERASWEDTGAADAADAGRRARGEQPRDRDPDGDPTAHLDVCGVCPICVGLRALGTHRPELVGHLAEAARHLAAAVRSVVESGTEAPARRSHATPDDGLTRIDLDDLGGDDAHDGHDDRDDPDGGTQGPHRG